MLPYSENATKISLSLSLSLAPTQQVLQDRSRTLKSPGWNNYLNFALVWKKPPHCNSSKVKKF